MPYGNSDKLVCSEIYPYPIILTVIGEYRSIKNENKNNYGIFDF